MYRALWTGLNGHGRFNDDFFSDDFYPDAYQISLESFTPRFKVVPTEPNKPTMPVALIKLMLHLELLQFETHRALVDLQHMLEPVKTVQAARIIAMEPPVKQNPGESDEAFIQRQFVFNQKRFAACQEIIEAHRQAFVSGPISQMAGETKEEFEQRKALLQSPLVQKAEETDAEFAQRKHETRERQREYWITVHGALKTWNGLLVEMGPVQREVAKARAAFKQQEIQYNDANEKFKQEEATILVFNKQEKERALAFERQRTTRIMEHFRNCRLAREQPPPKRVRIPTMAIEEAPPKEVLTSIQEPIYVTFPAGTTKEIAPPGYVTFTEERQQPPGAVVLQAPSLEKEITRRILERWPTGKMRNATGFIERVNHAARTRGMGDWVQHVIEAPTVGAAVALLKTQ